MKITEYFNARNCTIQFEDGTIVKNKYYRIVTLGKVVNYNKPSVYNLGYRGYGKYKSSFNNIKSLDWNKWYDTFYRSYDIEFHKTNMTYRDCTVETRWHNFQVFAQWFEDNWKPWMDSGWALDKDILVKGNKIYSPETCCFVPHEINSLFETRKSKRGKYPIGVTKVGDRFHAQISLGKETGGVCLGYYDKPEEAFQAYKNAKEIYIKKVADQWKNRIASETYEAMYRWEILITD